MPPAPRSPRAPLFSIASVVIAAAAVPHIAMTASADADESEQGTTDPSVVSVPYLSAAELAINPAWTLASCPAFTGPDTAPDTVTVTCDEDGAVTVAATAYAPDIGPWPLVASVVTSTGEVRDFEYTVTLAPPDAPAVREGTYSSPGIAGGRTLIPWADLISDCTYCAEGIQASVTVVVEEGFPAATAWVADRHLVIDAPADATEVALDIKVADSSGQWSQAESVVVPVRVLAEAGAAALHVIVPADAGGSARVQASDLLAVADPSTWTLVGCGTPAAGEVSCLADAIVYTRDPAVTATSTALDDQFTVTFRSEEGDTLTGSVTIAADAREPLALAPAAPTRLTTLLISTPPAPLAADTIARSNAGILSSLWQALPSID